MRSIILFLFVLLFATVASGCLVRTNRHHHGHGPAARCSPGHHWNGDRCVHNGRRHR